MTLRKAFPALILLFIALAAAADPVNVVLGTTDCFVIRVPDGDTSAAERAARIRTVFERSQGQPPGRFTIRAEGPRRLIDLDGDFLVAATPADAQATHHESAATLAPVWRDRLRLAWEASRSQPAASARAAAPAAARSESSMAIEVMAGLLLLLLVVLIAVLLRQSRQVTSLIQESAEWRREVGESLSQPRALAALPAGDGETLPASLHGEVVRLAREESQAAVNDAVQRICDSVERVMAGLLEEMARGMAQPPGTAASAGSPIGGPLTSREPALAGGARPATPGGANGGVERASGAIDSDGSERPESAIRAASSLEPPGRRGPVTLEIIAYGKTYAFPMASERAGDVLSAWEGGAAVPESWLHESGITTARLQPLLERFVLRRHLEADGSLSYLLDTRGGAVRIALRNAG
jgi:hypothetical protein